MHSRADLTNRGYAACLLKRSGSMPVGAEVFLQLPFTSVILFRPTTPTSTATTLTVERRKGLSLGELAQLVPTARMLLDSMTCTGMSGSGARTGTLPTWAD